MLSLQECRKILGPTCTLTDPELDLLREGFYALAHITHETYPKLGSPKAKTLLNQHQRVNFESMLNLLSEAEREEAIERVAIMEFESGFPREEAEKAVMSKYFKPHNRN